MPIADLTDRTLTELTSFAGRTAVLTGAASAIDVHGAFCAPAPPPAGCGTAVPAEWS